MRGVESIVRHRPSTEIDRWGDPTSAEPDLLIRGCVIVPRGIGGELNQNAHTVISGLQVFCPPGTDLRPTDEVTARGARYEVDGEPADYRSAAGQRKTVMVNLRRVQG